MKASKIVFGCTFLVCSLAAPSHAQSFRPPAVPLVTFDPYFSIWSFANRLTDDSTRHWTGAEQSLESAVRIDGKPYRMMGSSPQTVPAMAQTDLRVLPTRTIYDFKAASVS